MDEPTDESTARKAALDAKEEAKRKFREALDAKQHRHADALANSPAALHPHTAPAKARRTFRRKSG